MSITLVHGPRGSITVECPNPLEYKDETFLYFCGDTKPNYPVPAIPLKVRFEWFVSHSKFPQHKTHHANDRLILRIYRYGNVSRIGNRWQSWYGASVRFTNDYDGEFTYY